MCRDLRVLVCLELFVRTEIDDSTQQEKLIKVFYISIVRCVIAVWLRAQTHGAWRC